MLENFANELAIIVTFTGTIMSLGYVPQIQKIWKRKSVEDISIPTFIILFVGLIVWLLYGLSINAYPIIIANSIGLVVIGVLIFSYFKFKKK